MDIWPNLSFFHLLVADTKGQDNQDAHARISEVKNGVAVANGLECCCWVKVAAIATAASSIILEKVTQGAYAADSC